MKIEHNLDYVLKKRGTMDAQEVRKALRAALNKGYEVIEEKCKDYLQASKVETARGLRKDRNQQGIGVDSGRTIKKPLLKQVKVTTKKAEVVIKPRTQGSAIWENKGFHYSQHRHAMWLAPTIDKYSQEFYAAIVEHLEEIMGDG